LNLDLAIARGDETVTMCAWPARWEVV